MNEHEIAKKITAYLDRGTADLRAGTVFRLQRARQLALSQLAERQHAPALAVAGPGGGMFGERRFAGALRIGIGVLLLGGAILGYQYWQAAQQARDIEETDAAILTSELPIEAYLDQGFQAWLKRSEP
ncbi:MAG TPA: DUF3619 family protein [Casimicrobiaceae bacterium]|jgi:hypothetical protein|nr:DUF3619 family protein [Casimicrobiaceae bacterium]